MTMPVAMLTLTHIATIWGFCLLLAFLGWGRSLLLAARCYDGNVGVAQAAGMSCSLLVGGLALSLGQLSAPLVVIWVILGMALSLLELPEAIQRVRALDRYAMMAIGIAVVLCALVIFAHASWPYEWDFNDDGVAYLQFAREIAETGALEQPFSMRRAVTLGGQQVLHGLFLAVGSIESLHVVDGGVGRVVFACIVAGLLAETLKHRPIVWLLAVAAALFIPAPKINTSSVFTSAVCVLAVLALVARSDSRASPGGLVIAALIAAAAASFRAHVGAACASVFVVSECLWAAGSHWHAAALRTTARRIALFAVFSATALIPLAAMLWRDAGTPIYPPIMGRIDPVFASMHALPFGMSALRQVFVFVTAPASLALCVPPMLLAITCRITRACVVVSVCFMVAAAALMSALTYGYFLRYTWPIPGAIAVWAIARALNERSRWAPYMLASFYLPALAWAGTLEQVWRTGTAIGRPPTALFGDDRVTEAQQAQASIEPGQVVLVMMDAPYLLDHTRNTIINLDMPGAISPRPGLPWKSGTDDIVRYLSELGVSTIIRTTPDASLMFYSREYWENHPRPEKFYRDVWAPPMLAMMTHLDHLAATCTSESFGSTQVILLCRPDATPTVPPEQDAHAASQTNPANQP